MKREEKLTVEFVLEFSTRAQHGAFKLLARKKCEERQAQQVVGQHPSRDLEVHQAKEAGPSRLPGQLLPCKRGRREKRRRGAPADVVAQKGEGVAEDRETKGQNAHARSSKYRQSERQLGQVREPTGQRTHSEEHCEQAQSPWSAPS